MNRQAFFAAVRKKPFGGSLSQQAVDCLSAILDAFAKAGDGDANKLAYLCATGFHESDRFRTMEEYASGAAYEGRKDLGNTQPGDGKRFKGRGLVQITGRKNYNDWAQRLGNDMLSHPETASELYNAAPILVEGSLLGTFTGKKLGDYITASKVDFKSARRVINGTDKADLIAGYAQDFAKAIRTADVPVPEPAKPTDPAEGQSVIATLRIDLDKALARIDALERLVENPAA